MSENTAGETYQEFVLRIEKIVPVLASDLVAVTSYLPAVSGIEAKTAIALLAALASSFGNCHEGLARAVANGMERHGGSVNLLKVCKEISAMPSMADRSIASSKAFGRSRYSYGLKLICQDILKEADRLIVSI